MKHFLKFLLVLLTATGTLRAMPIVNTPDYGLDLGVRLQFLANGEVVNDPYAQHNRLYMFLKESRLLVNGRYGDEKLKVEMALGAEDTVGVPDPMDPGVPMGLLEFSLDSPLAGPVYLKIGQFKIPYGRERLDDSGSLAFADRSIQNWTSQMGYDTGMALHAQGDDLAAAAGVFTGAGMDLFRSYIPESLGFPLMVARAGYDNGVDSDPFTASQVPTPGSGAHEAFYINGYYTKDSAVGGNTILNERLTQLSMLPEDNLLLLWNPYIGVAPFSLGELWMVGADSVVRIPAADGIVSIQAEANYGGYSNGYGALHVGGGEFQANWFGPYLAVGARYAIIFPDAGFGANGQSVTGTQVIQEITPSLSIPVRKNITVILDAPILVDVPVFMDPNEPGSFVATEHPDTAGNGSTNRQTVPEGRLQIQSVF